MELIIKINKEMIRSALIPGSSKWPKLEAMAGIRRLRRLLGFESLKSRFAAHDWERYEKEQLILVNEADEEIGSENIVVSHLTEFVKEAGVPHRAFSVFLFDRDFNLLMQRRALTKPLFANYWANSCCSHPLKNKQGEDERAGAVGVRRAAGRRLREELNLQFEADELFLKKIVLYRALYDATFSEFEMDYVLVCRGQGSKPEIEVNPREVSEVKWVAPEDYVKESIEMRKRGERVSPWMEKLADDEFIDWWKRCKLQNELKAAHKIELPSVINTLNY